jgi:hypothetical protein
MKKLIWLVSGCLLILSLENCQKDKNGCPDGWQDARIIGQDFRRCACCGGWFIDLGQDTVRTFILPDDFKIEAIPPDLPIEVCLTYEPETGPCQDFADLIVVDKIRRKSN